MKDSHQELKKILLEVANQIGLDSKKVMSQVSNVLKSEITYLPIRHHSPSSSILVKKWIETKKPELVLIEGPSTASDLIPFIVDPGSKPPIAILSIFTDYKNKFKLNGLLSSDPTIPAKFQVYFPFVSYSPELIACKICISKKIPIFFIDLPLTGIIPYMVNQEQQFKIYLDQEESQVTSSSFFRRLTRVFDFDSFNETWESLFEINANQKDMSQLREEILIFSTCVRFSMNEGLMKKQGVLVRESYMRHQIEKYINDLGIDKRKVLVITGGIHSINLSTIKPAKKAFPIRGLLDSLVPFSYLKISQRTGYGSGNHGPMYYDYIWERFEKNELKCFENTALEVITDVFRNARKQGNLISISDSINAFNSAKMLGMLRRRSEPGLKDIIDAVFMTVVKGNPEIEGRFLDKFLNKHITGLKIGKVTDKIGKLPLQKDFFNLFESIGIELTESVQQIKLDLREDEDVIISQALWRVNFLGLKFLERIKGPNVLKGNTGTFTEIWSLNWSSEIETKLIELSSYGSSVEEASKNKLIEESQKQKKNFEKITELLFQSILMGLRKQFETIFDECMDSLEADDQLSSLIAGFFNLIMIFRYMLMTENQDDYNIKLIIKIIKRNYFSCCFSIPNLANPPDDIRDKFISNLKDFSHILNSISDISLDSSVFLGSLNSCINNSEDHFIIGGCYGVLYLMNSIMISEIEKKVVNYVNSSDRIKVKIGHFIRGIVFVCQSKILLNKEIIKTFSEVIESLEWHIFSAILPALRKGFSELDSKDYDIFTEKLAEHYGLKDIDLREIREIEVNEYLNFFEEVDSKAKDVLKEWFKEI